MLQLLWKAKVKHSRRSAFSGGRAGGRRAPGPPNAYLGRNGRGGLLPIYRHILKCPEIPRNIQKYPFLMGVLDHKAPQQLAGKTVGIKISIFGNSSWPLTARNVPKRAVLGPFWGIAGRLRLARKFITFFYCRAIKFFCAASYRQTTVAYLRTFVVQQFRPPTQGIA